MKVSSIQGAAISRQPNLILYAYDVATGVVVDIGDCLNIVPIVDGTFWFYVAKLRNSVKFLVGLVD